MTHASRGSLGHALLEGVGVLHGFGRRDARPPDGVVRPSQVHGVAVAVAKQGRVDPLQADAIVSSDSGHPVGVVTADCVPVLAATADGSAVVAIHAGWRGLAAGIVGRGLDALRRVAPAGGEPVAVVGPHIGPCCYEVDEPVLGPLRARFGTSVEAATRLVGPSGPGHWMLDLGRLVTLDLERAGVAPDRQGRIPESCTFCNHEFHSHRRDGDRSGRLLHYVQSRPPS